MTKPSQPELKFEYLTPAGVDVFFAHCKCEANCALRMIIKKRLSIEDNTGNRICSCFVKIVTH